MTETTTAQRGRASDEHPERPCGSAEAAVVRWALTHLEAGRLSLPAVERDAAVEPDEAG